MAEWSFVETFASKDLQHKIICPSSTPNTPQVFTGEKSVKWKYWLGGGNHECFGAQDSCMYLRARKNNEECDYGYLTNAYPLSGGLKSLSFSWKQGGNEAEITNYDIAILVNDVLVGEIKQAARPTYTAPDSTPFYYELNDLNIEGDFTIRIENRTQYTGSVSVNRGRFVFNDLKLTMLEDEPAGPLVHGYVLDQNNQPVSAAVSDGFTVVKTDEKGFYSIELNNFSEFVSVIVPGGYDIPLDEIGFPHMYAPVTLFGDQRVDFTLNRQADNGKADSTHVMLVISDPQVLDNYNVWRYREESLKDMKELIASYPKGTKIYTSIVGDVVWDWYNAFETQKKNMASLGVPCLVTIGNHDHNCKAKCVGEAEQDRLADDLYTAVFGPTYYSYNIGTIHYISLDNIYYTGCGGEKGYKYVIPEYQKEWLRQDLELVPDGTPIVIFCHASMSSSYGSLIPELMELLNKGNVTQYILSGHTHNPHTYYHSEFLRELNLGAVKGAFWAANICGDGTPNGYEVMQAGPKGYTDYYYKSTGFDRNFQFRAYAPGNIASDHMSDQVRATVWGYEKDWQVYIYENGEKSEMKKYSGTDPIAYDIMQEDGDKRPNYPGSDGGTIASKNPGYVMSGGHMFRYQPKDPNAYMEVEVVDRWGYVYRGPVTHNIMTAEFADQDTAWVYEQDFNGLFAYPNHFKADLAKGTFVQGHYPLGWYATTGGTTGSKFATFNYYRIGNGSHSSSGLYNYGEGDPSVANKNKTERCIGLQPGNTDRGIAVGVVIENNTQERITSLDIEYTGEVWRVMESTAAHTMTFDYLVNPDISALRDRAKWVGELPMIPFTKLNFSTPSTLIASGTNTAVDGNNANNRKTVKATLPVILEPRECILLRWTNPYNNGKEQGFGVDDVKIKAQTEPTALYNVKTPAENVKKTYRDGQILIIKNKHVYNLLGIQQ